MTTPALSLLAQVQVELKKGKTIMTDAALQQHAGFLHARFSNRSGIRPECFALYHGGRKLEGEEALSSWGVRKDAIIEVKMRGRGGGNVCCGKEVDPPLPQSAGGVTPRLVAGGGDPLATLAPVEADGSGGNGTAAIEQALEATTMPPASKSLSEVKEMARHKAGEAEQAAAMKCAVPGKAEKAYARAGELNLEGSGREAAATEEMVLSLERRMLKAPMRPLELVNPPESARSYAAGETPSAGGFLSVLGSKGEWKVASPDKSRWLALDLSELRCVHAIVIQCGSLSLCFSGWVTKLKVHVSTVTSPSEADWKNLGRDIITSCTSDPALEVTLPMPEPMWVRHIRLTPLEWKVSSTSSDERHITMRAAALATHQRAHDEAESELPAADLQPTARIKHAPGTKLMVYRNGAFVDATVVEYCGGEQHGNSHLLKFQGKQKEQLTKEQILMQVRELG